MNQPKKIELKLLYPGENLKNWMDRIINKTPGKLRDIFRLTI